MKILYVITGLGGGGAEKVVADLADKMYERGHEVKIAFLKGNIIVRPNNKDIELISLGLENISRIFTTLKKFKSLVYSFKPDVVHAHMVHANIFTRLARKYIYIPRLICTAHSNNEGGRLRMLAYRLTHNLADLTTNVSQKACMSFESLGAVPKGKIFNIYNGIDLQKFKYSEQIRIKTRHILQIDDKTLMFLAVGRLHEAKDYPLLINAFAEFLNEISENDSDISAKLFIVGDGELRPTIEALIAQHQLKENIILLGRRDNISELMCASDYFVLSSSYEGFALVVAEAMACETLVIATDCGGVKEVLGGNGILVPVQNNQALCKAFYKVVSMPEFEKQKYQKSALKHIRDNFDLDQIVEKWEDLYVSK